MIISGLPVTSSVDLSWCIDEVSITVLDFVGTNETRVSLLVNTYTEKPTYILLAGKSSFGISFLFF